MSEKARCLQAQRVVEETLQTTNYAPQEPLLLACTLPGTDGRPVVVAQYWLYPDGTFVRMEWEGDTSTENLQEEQGGCDV